MFSMIIAVDGPAGAGKSTVCRLLAKELGYTYLDTGAMYRAVAWALIEIGISPEKADPHTIARLPLGFAIDDGRLHISYEGKILDEELRPPEISQHASRISQLGPVRNFLTDWQRRLAESGRVVAEGRDMTTAVFPNAPVKVFLTADLETRAKRRHAEYLQKGITVDYSELEAQIQARDEADQKRALAPLAPAADALVVDTSGMSIPEVVEVLMGYVDRIKRSIDTP